MHFVGEMSGAAPPDFCVQELLQRYPNLKTRIPPLAKAIERQAPISYTQWEAWLALFLRKTMLIVIPSETAARGPKFAPTAETKKAQDDHLKRLKSIDLFPGDPFVNGDGLTIQILQSAVIPALKRAAREGVAAARQPRNLPFISLGDLFKGRDKQLEALHSALAAANGAGVLVRALHGLGGIGKSRLAVEYAWKHEAEYSALLFVRAESAVALNANLAALVGASLLDLPEKGAREDAAKIEAVLRWLEASPTWLLILDNVDDSDAVAAVTALMPRLNGGHVIVTARAANFPATIRKLELDVLGQDAATQFLLERTADDRQRAKDDDVQAGMLARELGGLALGLEQAGAQIATDRIGFARYLKLWNESREKLFAWSDPTLTGSEKTLATTWATSVARLPPQSVRLLDRLAMLAPDPIPDSLLDVAVPGEDAGYDTQKARAGLFAYSLIARAKGEDGQGFVIHRLVQDFARRAMTMERRNAALREALAWVNAAFVGHPQDVRTWPILDPLAPHAFVVARHAHAAGIAEPTGRLFNELAQLFHAKARFAEAEPLMHRVIEINEAVRGKDDPVVATCLDNLAVLLKDTNRLAEAEPLMRRALAIDEKSYGADHPKVTLRLNNLAALLQATNRLAEAEPLMRRALAIDEKSNGRDHPDVAGDLNNLGQLLQATNRLVEAEPLMRRALVISETSYGPDHPKVAICLSNLAGLLKDANRLAEAEPLMRRALKIDETSYGPDHPNVARDLNNLAQLLETTNRPAAAEPLYRRALAVDETSYGPDHPNVAIRLNNLANLLRATNRLAEAEPLMRRALKIDETSYGPDHPNVARYLNGLALLLQATNRPAAAEPLYRRALAIDETSYGPDHPNVAIRLNNLANLLRATNRLAEAEPLMRRALALREKSYGPDHPNVGQALNNLAMLLLATKRRDEAKSLLRRALPVLETSLGVDHPYTVGARRNLAAIEAVHEKGT